MNELHTLGLDSALTSRIEAWLAAPYDAETIGAVRQLITAGDATALTDAFYKDLEFGTGGLRGIVGEGTNRMNRYTVGRATQGFANYLRRSFPGEQLKVAISYDSRH